jgi:hypothetical protein
MFLSEQSGAYSDPATAELLDCASAKDFVECAGGTAALLLAEGFSMPVLIVLSS